MPQDSAIADDVQERLDQCAEALGYRFHDRQLLELCLTHASVARTRLASNERLEFLGDAVLGLVVCEMLFHRYPGCAEGEMTRLKSELVSRRTCAKLSQEMGLEHYMFLGKGLGPVEQVPSSILGAVFEALVAGIYIDGGLEAAREFIHRVLRNEMNPKEGQKQSRNYKSVLQHYAQSHFGHTPAYRMLDQQGPDHSKAFRVAAMIGEDLYPPAWGSSKKEAEQAAAKAALAELHDEDM